MSENAIAEEIVDAAFRIHTTLGPGLLESVCETVLAYELDHRGLRIVRQQLIPVIYENVRIDTGFRADLIVEDKVIVEVCDSRRRSLPGRQAVDPSSLQRLLPAGQGPLSCFPRQVRGGPETRFPKRRTTFPSSLKALEGEKTFAAFFGNCSARIGWFMPSSPSAARSMYCTTWPDTRTG